MCAGWVLGIDGQCFGTPKDVCLQETYCMWCMHGFNGKPCEKRQDGMEGCEGRVSTCMDTSLCCQECLFDVDCCSAVSEYCCMRSGINTCQGRESNDCATEPGSNTDGDTSESGSNTGGGSSSNTNPATKHESNITSSTPNTVAAFPYLCALVIALITKVESENQW